MTKYQALAIGPPPDFKDTAAAEIFYWQLTGMEWDGSRSAYHSHATKKWRRLTQYEQAAASAREANAAQHADARDSQKMAEEIDNDFGVRIVKMVAVLVVQASKTFPSLLSTELREGGADLAGLAARLEAVQSMPLAGSKNVTRAIGIDQSALLALNMLCELEDSLGVQGLNPDWHTRNRDPREYGTV